MLQFYFSSVFIYMIIINCVAIILKPKLIDNGWIDPNKHAPFLRRVTNLFVLSAVPVLRLLIISGMLYMTTITKEEFEHGRKD